MSENTRPRGVLVYPMPKEVCGPLDHYALAVRDNSEGLQCRMVHTEGVSYLVTSERPWTWNDYDPECPKFTIEDLMKLMGKSVDLADWVRTFGARLETNFALIYHWCNED